MSTLDTSCHKCGQRPNRETNMARKVWMTTAGVRWAYRCRCGANNNLLGRPGWAEFAAAQAAVAKVAP